MRRYRCLVFDHDDTVVNSTAEIHHPSFLETLSVLRPGAKMSFEEYMLANFSPGFLPLCRDVFCFTDEEMNYELKTWRACVERRTPSAFEGIARVMARHKREGGLICVVSHSFAANILRDYRANGLPAPDLVFGWDLPQAQRKPNPYPLAQIMRSFSLAPADLLVIDDLKPGYDMARAAGVDFAAAGWAYHIPEIERAMRGFRVPYLRTVDELMRHLF